MDSNSVFNQITLVHMLSHWRTMGGTEDGHVFLRSLLSYSKMVPKCTKTLHFQTKKILKIWPSPMAREHLSTHHSCQVSLPASRFWLCHRVVDVLGMVWQNGETWQDMRQCVMKALGGCGMPSAIQSESLEERIQHEVGKLVREFAKFEQECKPFCPFELLHKAVCNIICSIVFGCRSVVVVVVVVVVIVVVVAVVRAGM